MVRVTRQGIQWIDMVGFVAHKVIYIRIVANMVGLLVVSCYRLLRNVDEAILRHFLMVV